MYNLADYEPYTLSKTLTPKPVLTWCKQNGYQFLPILERMKGMLALDLKIIAIPKEDNK